MPCEGGLGLRFASAGAGWLPRFASEAGAKPSNYCVWSVKQVLEQRGVTWGLGAEMIRGRRWEIKEFALTELSSWVQPGLF